MSDVKCARMLLKAAERDLATLRSMTAEAPEESFGFHVQQAAEKALKAWIAMRGETYPLSHNIGVLLDLLVDTGADLEPFHGLMGYTPYAVEFRYQGVPSGIKAIDREGAMELIEALLGEVRGKLAESE